VGLKSLKSLNLTNGYPNNKNKKNNKVKSKPLELRLGVKVDCYGKGLRSGLFRTFEDFEFRAGFFRFLRSVPV
jgi:hypothetical protein